MRTDWATLRMQYEIFGTPVQTLAEEGGTSVSLIEYAIKDEGWSRQALAKIPETPSDELMEDLNGKLETMYTLKQANFQERFLKLESQIISKGIEIVSSIQSDHPTAAAQLRTVNQVLTALKDAAMLDGGQRRKQEGDGGGLSIKILNVWGEQSGQNPLNGESIAIEIDGTQVPS